MSIHAQQGKRFTKDGVLQLRFPVKLSITPVNAVRLSSFSIPVELLNVIDAESAVSSSSVAPAPIVARSYRARKRTRDLEGGAGRDIDAESAVAIEVLVEDGLEVLQRRTGARNAAGEIGDVVAIAVGAPDVEQPGGGVVEGDIVAARGVLGADRRPAGPHAGCDWCAAVESAPVL